MAAGGSASDPTNSAQPDPQLEFGEGKGRRKKRERKRRTRVGEKGSKGERGRGKRKGKAGGKGKWRKGKRGILCSCDYSSEKNPELHAQIKSSHCRGVYAI